MRLEVKLAVVLAAAAIWAAGCDGGHPASGLSSSQLRAQRVSSVRAALVQSSVMVAPADVRSGKGRPYTFTVAAPKGTLVTMAFSCAGVGRLNIETPPDHLLTAVGCTNAQQPGPAGGASFKTPSDLETVIVVRPAPGQQWWGAVEPASTGG